MARFTGLPPKTARLLGISLFVVSSLAWLAVFVLPFTGIGGGKLAGWITGLIVFAEVAFALSIAFIGRQIINRFKAIWRELVRKP